MANDLSSFINMFTNIEDAVKKGAEEGLKKAGVRIMGTAKEKLGEYQPSSGEFTAWSILEAETVRRKFLAKSRVPGANGRTKRKLTNAGKKFLSQYGTGGKKKKFQASGNNDDMPLVDSGHLRAAITTDDSEIDIGNIYVGVAGGSAERGASPAVYGAVHEYGYAPKGIPPRPFLRPSVFENKDEIENDIKQAIANAVMGVRK